MTKHRHTTHARWANLYEQITCVKTSQGFDWNTGIFLPSYMADHDDAAEMEHRQDPVEDIFLTEEEEREMFPIGNL